MSLFIKDIRQIVLYNLSEHTLIGKVHRQHKSAAHSTTENHLFPVEPKPFSPRSVSESSFDSIKSAAKYGVNTI